MGDSGAHGAAVVDSGGAGRLPADLWEHREKGGVLAAKAVETQGKGGVFATKGSGNTQGRGGVLTMA